MRRDAKGSIGVVLAVAFALLGCEDSVEDVAGVWSAPYGHMGGVTVSLKQDGRSLTGTACRAEYPGVVFSGARVAGTYPDVSFSVNYDNLAACCKDWSRQTFQGSFAEDGTLKGHFFSGGVMVGAELLFARTSGRTCIEDR